jgi:hypothetical protein
MSQEYVSIKQLANELGMDRSHARRYVLSLGVEPKKHRTADSGGQLTLTVTPDEAEFIKRQREEKGYLGSTKPVDNEAGFFYVIQLVPELDERRIKLGFAENAHQRLTQHRTSAPTAKLMHSWPCKRTWEKTVIDALVSIGGKLILNEVYEFEDVEVLIEHGEKLFALLGDPAARADVSSVSPHVSNDNDQGA